MFVIGEAESAVYYSKLRLPKEYNLRKKDRKIYGTWIGEWILYLSDEKSPLKSKADRNGTIFHAMIDAESRIDVPSYLDERKAIIRGCITTIQIEFIK